MRDSLTKAGVDHPEFGFVKAADPVEASNISMREKTARWLLALFAFAVICTYALIFLWGWKKISLPDAFVHWLGAATVGQTAGLLLIIVRNLFPSHEKRG